MEKCNCGREGRYSFTVDGENVTSCNKYSVCLPREDLEKRALYYEQLFENALRTAFDLSIYREGTEHYRNALHNLELLEKKMNSF